MTDLSIEQSAKTRMVSSASHSKFLAGQCGMEIAVLLLLTLPLTAASPLRPAPRSDKDVVLPGASVQTVEEERSEVMQPQRRRAAPLKIVPFHSDDRHFDMDALKLSTAAKLRPRRAPQGGCQLGTCQVHNLVKALDEINKNNGKEESKNAKSSWGYGR